MTAIMEVSASTYPKDFQLRMIQPPKEHLKNSGVFSVVTMPEGTQQECEGLATLL